ncbi:hypothetical protein VZO05_00510 [Aggregatilineales bacterium SYSU G02658]
MNFEQLANELRKLNRIDKLRAMHLLVNELAAEDGREAGSAVPYEIITPHGNEAAAAVLYEFLQSNNDKG